VGTREPTLTELQVFDLTEDALEQAARRTLVGDYYELHARGTRMITAQEQGVLVLDAQDPGAPETLVRETAGRHCYLAVVEDDYGLCIGSGTVQRIDLTP
jgi:hypothetical protein